MTRSSSFCTQRYKDIKERRPMLLAIEDQQACIDFSRNGHLAYSCNKLQTKENLLK